MLPLYSVIVPAYQAVATIGQCLDALNAQTTARTQYEIVVVDDGSTDDTAQVAERKGADRVLRCPHRGPAAARNAGIDAAHGHVILLTDADCEPQPDWLALMLEPFVDPEVAGVKGSYVTRQTAIVPRLAQCEFEERYDLQERRPTIDFVDSYAAAFRTSVLRAAGGFDPVFTRANNEDVELSYRLARLGHKLVFVRRAQVAHRHVATWRGYFRVKRGRGFWRMLVYRLHPGKALRDSYTPQTLKFQILLVYATAALVLAACFWHPLAWGALVSLGGLVLSGWDFYKLVRTQDPAVSVWAPFFIVTRAVAFALGVAAGLIGLLFHRPSTTPGLAERG